LVGVNGTAGRAFGEGSPFSCGYKRKGPSCYLDPSFLFLLEQDTGSERLPRQMVKSKTTHNINLDRQLPESSVCLKSIAVQLNSGELSGKQQLWVPHREGSPSSPHLFTSDRSTGSCFLSMISLSLVMVRLHLTVENSTRLPVVLL
jgi:hypothetical protein